MTTETELLAKAREIAALEWYQEQAEACQRAMSDKPNVTAMTAILTTLALDGGFRAEAALAALRSAQPPAETLKGEWFYFGDDTDSENCSYSPEEAVEDGYFYGNPKTPGLHYVPVDQATMLPRLHYVVEVFSEEEKDIREDDEEYVLREYPNEDAAKAAVAQWVLDTAAVNEGEVK
jgi:hypothetical protein